MRMMSFFLTVSVIAVCSYFYWGAEKKEASIKEASYYYNIEIFSTTIAQIESKGKDFRQLNPVDIY